LKKVLVALDPRNASSSSTFELALDLAKKGNCELLLYHCLPEETVAEVEDRIGLVAELEQSEALRKVDHRRQREAEHVRAWLDDLCGQAQGEGLSAASTVEVGKPGSAIVDLATHWGADLIVLGWTRHGSLRERLVGGIVSHLTHHAPCSVLLVHGGASPGA